MNEPIAIVGMACRFPGAPTPAAYWELLTTGVDAVGDPPCGREGLDPPGWLLQQTPACRRAGFLQDIDLFEPGFFRISRREAARMDPQQRLLLEVAWEALEDAGQPVAPLSGSSTGVFVGIMNADFARLHAQDLAQLDAQLGPGSSLGIASNRISFLLDLRGPSMSVDTLCSSSLVAVHLACQSLWMDESSPVAIAGGVNVILDRTMDVFYARAGLLSADGRCRSFDAGAGGIVRGEGIGLLVLKRLSRARADGDRIHAVILGSAVNQDGRSNGLTSPSRWSQEEVLRTAYRRAGVVPARVSCIEAHGTGTLIGDPIEAAALGAVLGEGRDPQRPCAIGAVKTNLGHLESAAGIAGLVKAVLSLSHRTIAPTLHFEAPNPYARLDERGLYVPTWVQPWPDHGDGPVVTGVSSFGMGGTNAHVVLGAVEATKRPARRSGPRASLLPISAQSVAALDALQRSYADLLSGGSVELVDVAHSAGARGNHHDHRRAIVAASTEEAASLLRGEATVAGKVVPGRTHKLVLVLPEDPEHDLDVGALQTSLIALFRSLGLEPDAVIGVSTSARQAGIEAAAASLGEDGTVFLEIGTRPVLLAELREILAHAEAGGVAVSAMISGEGERASILRALAELYCLGLPIDFRKLDAEDARFVALGSHPWQRERCWLDPPLGRHEVVDEALLVPSWEPAPLLARKRARLDEGTWLVLGDRAETAGRLAARLEAAGHAARVIETPEDPAALDRIMADGRWCGIVRVDEGEPRSDAAAAALDRAGRELEAIVRLVQALGRAEGTSPPHAWLVTRGAREASGDATLSSLAGSTTWGLGRVATAELPRLRCTLVDLPRSEISDAVLDGLVTELSSGSDEPEIALSAGERFVARLRRAPLATPASRVRLHPDATYLVAGGLGGLGLAAARLLARRGARRLLLLGRAGVTTEVQRAAIAEMAAAGATVTVERVDVGDRDALRSVLRKPVRGVIHAAGVMAPAMISALGPAAITEHLAAKTRGALHLHELTAGEPLDFFVLYSSIATLLGMPGQAAYAAANAYLDALAHHRRAIGLPATSIAWTVIEDTGMAARAGPRALRQLADRGIGTLSVKRATAVLEQVLALDDPPAHVGVVPFDLGRWSVFNPQAARSPRLAPLGDPATEDRAPVDATPAAAELAADLRARAEPDRTRALEAYLCRRVADVLHHPEPLEPTQSLYALGIDSLTAVELQSLLEAELDLEVPVAALLDGPAVAELAARLSAMLAPAADEAPTRARADDVSVLHSDARLDPTIVPVRAGARAGARARRSADPSRGHAPGDILLTGATGFLGAFILARLLERTQATIHCLVRAPTPAEGMRRLQAVLARHDLADIDGAERIACVPGDLARPDLGMNPQDVDRLAGSVHAVVHSGAAVNFVFPYEALRAANVDGTVGVLRLAARGRAKRVHHVSTIGVFPGGPGELATVHEGARPGRPERLALGYMRAKWVAEQLVTQARERGIAASIYRPGTIFAHSASGAFNVDDFLCVMIKGCVQLGVAPGVDAPLHLAPVDYVSRALVDIALSAPAAEHAVHLVGPRPVPFTELLAWMRDLGYRLDEVPYRQWRTRVLERAATTGNALLPLLPLLAAHEDTDWLRLPPFDTARTEQALAGADVGRPQVDAALVQRWVERGVATGWLPQPTAVAPGRVRTPPGPSGTRP